MGMRKLASVQVLSGKGLIPGADLIERVDVLGWSCVAKKGDFKAGDMAVYVEVDAFLPVKPEYEFLRKSCYRKLSNGEEGFRIKTIRLRGQLSQGLVLPVPPTLAGLPVGSDVSATLSITKYEPPVPACLAGQVVGNFPGYIPKTDEIRVQSAPKVLSEFQCKDVYISTKMDGASMTVFKRGGYVGVCSRNLELKETEGNSLWQVATRYKLRETLPNNLAVQMEVVGPGIQKNPLNLKEVDAYVFNVFDITAGKYLDYAAALDIVTTLGLKFVPVEYTGPFSFALGDLLEKAKGKYPGTSSNKEGIVIRPLIETRSEVLKGRLSIKVINNDYLLEEE